VGQDITEKHEQALAIAADVSQVGQLALPPPP
jgi:hypothetical protein